MAWISHPIGWIVALVYVTEIPFRFILDQNLIRFKRYAVWHKRLFTIPQVLLLGIYLSYITKSSNPYLNYGYIVILVWIIVSAAVTTWIKTHDEFINQSINSSLQLLATGIIIVIQGLVSFQKPLLSELGMVSIFVIVYGVFTIPIGLLFLHTKIRRVLVLGRLIFTLVLGILYHIYL